MKAGHSPSACSWERLSPFLELSPLLLARHMVNNVYAQIGLVMLIGLAAKNAILIVEFARLEYEKGKARSADAALTGARIRLRPILMTSFAFVFGCIPLWIASGAGGVFAADIGHGRHRGMLAATCIAIFLIPVTFYVSRSSPFIFKSHPDSAHPPPPREGEAEMTKLLRLWLCRSCSIIAFLIAAGCAVGPNYKRPPVDAPAQFNRSADPTSSQFFG